jgi:hypothetical protein
MRQGIGVGIEEAELETTCRKFQGESLSNWTPSKFVGEVRRRIAFARGAQSLAIALAAAAGLGVILMPIVWWCDESGTRLAYGMLAIGAVTGIIWGFTRRPTRLDAAVEADRQLGFDDLLGTIESLGPGGKSGWGAALLSFAEQRCKWALATDVKVKRVGLRRWSGVGVLIGLLMTLAMFGERTDNTGAAGARLALAGTLEEYARSIARGPGDSGVARPPGPGGVDPSNRGAAEDRTEESDSGLASPGDQASHSAGLSPSVGSGQAQTKNRSTGARQQIRSGNNVPAHTGSAGAGIGESDMNAKLSGQNDSTVAMEASDTAEVAAWKSTDWAADSQKTMSVGQVPDEDADLVREFFKRD